MPDPPNDRVVHPVHGKQNEQNEQKNRHENIIITSYKKTIKKKVSCVYPLYSGLALCTRLVSSGFENVPDVLFL